MSQRTLTIGLLSIITILSIHVLYRVLEGATADVTSQHIYSLSEGTRQILDRMSDEGVQPVEITLYFSETTGNTLPRFIKDFITYERYLRHLLRSYERAAQGKIEVSFIDPFTDSDEAVEAVQDGLEGRAINQHGDQFFFGLTVETQTGSKDSIPFLWPEEQESVEYEISKRLTSLLWPGSKRIGILAGLEVFGTTDNPYLARMLAAQGRQPSEKWRRPTHRPACVVRRRVRFDVCNRITDALHRVRIVVRDLEAERRLKGHQQLERIQRIGPQVVAEARLVGDGVMIDAEMLRGEAPYLVSDCHAV